MSDTDATTCAHHWVIEPARGARSGRCLQALRSGQGRLRQLGPCAGRGRRHRPPADGPNGPTAWALHPAAENSGQYGPAGLLPPIGGGSRRRADGLVPWGAGSGRIAGPGTGARGAAVHRRLHRPGGDHANPVAGGCLPYCGGPERAGTGGVGPGYPGLGRLR